MADLYQPVVKIVTNTADLAATLDFAQDKFALDIVFNAAGIGKEESFVDGDAIGRAPSRSISTGP